MQHGAQGHVQPGASSAEAQRLSHTWLAAAALSTVCAAGKGVNTEVLKACSTKVAQACSTAHRAMRSEGLRVLELMSANCSSLKAQGCKVKWGNVLKVRAWHRLAGAPPAEQLLVECSSCDKPQLLPSRQWLSSMAVNARLPAVNQPIGKSPVLLLTKLLLAAAQTWRLCAGNAPDEPAAEPDHDHATQPHGPDQGGLPAAPAAQHAGPPLILSHCSLSLLGLSVGSRTTPWVARLLRPVGTDLTSVPAALRAASRVLT